MSETLAEEEKQRIRVELMTEIAKNEQDLEQCNEETGRYGREFLYNIRDLEQLCSITECPLTSHELKEFGIFPRKKSLFNRLWTHVKDIVTRPHKAEEEAARIAREKAEIEDIMNRLKEQSRRSEDSRIERDRIVKEQTERQIRENAAHLEKDRIEKAELEERIKIMEEQMRRSEEARIEMERWIEEEKDRKINEEEEKRFREEEARIEKERAETEERERKEKERIDKEEEDRKRKVVEKRRLRIEADVKSLLALPYESRVQAYRDFNLQKRRELRINEELAEIELKTEYRCERLQIERKEDHVKLNNWIRSDEKWKKCYEVLIPISEIEKELKILGKNTQFALIGFPGVKSEDRQIIEGIKSLKAKRIIVDNPSLNEFDLRSIVKNIEEVLIWSDSAVTLNVLMWIYENMRDGLFELNETDVFVPDEVRWSFLDKFGIFNRESLTFTGTNPNQKVSEEDDYVIINQGNLTVNVKKTKDEVGWLGRIGFRFHC